MSSTNSEERIDFGMTKDQIRGTKDEHHKLDTKEEDTSLLATLREEVKVLKKKVAQLEFFVGTYLIIG